MTETREEWTILDDCKALLEAVDHTLSVHGHMDAHTPLHDRLQRTLSTLTSHERQESK